MSWADISAKRCKKEAQSLETGVDCLDGTGPNRPFSTAKNPADGRLVRPTPLRCTRSQGLEERHLAGAINEKNGMDIWSGRNVAYSKTQIELVSLPGVEAMTRQLLIPANAWICRYSGQAAVGPEQTLNGWILAHCVRRWGCANLPAVDTCAAACVGVYPLTTARIEIGGRGPANPETPKNPDLWEWPPPDRGQGIEFDSMLLPGAFRLLIWVTKSLCNCNPETISTDSDTSDRLYFAR
jgi:hypothetical protein